MLVRNLPPAGNLRDVEGGIAAAVEGEKHRHGTVIEEISIIISNIADSMLLGACIVTAVIGGGGKRYEAGLFYKTDLIVICLDIEVSAPALEANEELKVALLQIAGIFK